MININKSINVKNICIGGMFVAASAILSNFKLFGSIAFDSMPAFLAGIIINPLVGGIIGFLGHFFTALGSSFPLTPPIHITIGIEMFLSVYIFSHIYKRNKAFGIITGVLLNGPISVVITGIIYSLTVGGMDVITFFKMMCIPLTFAGTANIIMAFAIERRVEKC